MILIHGICEDGKYLHWIADYISSRNLAHVYTPDLRGYGQKPKRRGDIDYIGQIEDDLADLIQWIKGKHGGIKIILVGHSAGGGTAIRFAGGDYADEVSAYLLLAPAIGPTAPVVRKNRSDGYESYIQIQMPRIIDLALLNAIGIKNFNGKTVMSINKPADVRHGTETLQLSFRLLMSRMPRMKYENNLKAITKPALVLVGENDEVFLPDLYAPLFSRYNQAKTKIVAGPQSRRPGG